MSDLAAPPRTLAHAALPWRNLPPAGLLIAGAAAAALVLLPIAHVAFEALQVPATVAARRLLRPLIGQLLVDTVGLMLVATLAAGLIGTAAAFCIERTRFFGRNIVAILLAVPLALPPFITSYAWVSLSPAFEGFWGALLVVTASYFPLVYLPVAAALRGLDPALEESAQALGVGRSGRILRVVLPQLRPALLGGMLLVALNVLVEFGAFTLLRYRTFTTEIYAEYRIGFNGPEAALLSAVLIGLCLVCLFAESRLRGGAHYARIDRGTRRAMRAQDLGALAIPVTAGLSGLVLATVGVPLGMIVYWLMRHNSAALSPVIASPMRILEATLASLRLGLYGTALTLTLALPLAYLSARYRGRFVTAVERTAYLAQGVPGIVVALALIAMTVRDLRPLYQTSLLLAMAYAILFLPLAVVSLRATFAQLPPRFEDAGRALGLSRLAVARRIILPLAGPGIGGAAALLFISIVTELTATLLLAPIGTETLATRIWADTSTMAFASAAPYAALMALLSLVSTWLLARRFGRAADVGPSRTGSA